RACPIRARRADASTLANFRENRLLPLARGLRNDGHLDRRLDLVTEHNADRPDAQSFERLVELDHVRLDQQVLAAHPAGNVLRPDRTIQVTVFRGVRLDVDAFGPGDLLGERLQVSLAGLASLLDTDLVALENAQVVLGRDNGQAVREQVVAGEPRLHLDHLSLLAD